MTEAYVVGVELALKGNVGKIVQGLIEEFSKLDAAVNGVNKALAGTKDAMRLLASDSAGIAKNWRDIAASAERFSRASRTTTAGRAGSEGPAAGGSLIRLPAPYVPPSYRPNFTTQGGPYDPPQPRSGLPVPYSAPTSYGPNGARSQIGVDEPFHEPIPLVNPYGRGAGGRGSGYPGFKLPRDPVMPAIGAGLGYELLKNTAEKGFSYDNWQARLQAKGFSDEQLQKAKDEAFRVQRTVPGAGVLGNLHLLSDMTSVIQDPTEAIAILPTLAQLQQDYARAGDAGGFSEMLSAIKVGEARALFTKNPKTGALDTTKFQELARNLLATYTQFNISPSQELQFLRNAATSGAMLSDTSLFAGQAALIQALGAGQAGTALAGYSRQFVSGKMSQASGNLELDMGLIKGGGTVKTNPYIKRNGPFNIFVKPGGYDEGVQLKMAEHPEAFIQENLFPAIDRYMARELGDKFTKASPEQKSVYELAQSQQLASSQTGGKEIAEAFRLKSQIDRDIPAQEAARRRNIDAMLKASPVNQAVAVQQAVEALQVAFSDPAIKQITSGMGALSQGVNEISKWAQANPDGSKAAFTGLAGGVAALGAGATLAALLALGGPAGALAGLGVGISALYAAVEYLQKKFPNPKTPEEWSNVPGTRLWFGKKLDEMLGHHPSSPDGYAPPNGVAPTGPLFGPQSPKPNAPMQPDASSPIRVHVDNEVSTRISNPGDLTHGISSGIARGMNAPPGGTMGHDLRMDAGAAPWIGVP